MSKKTLLTTIYFAAGIFGVAPPVHAEQKTDLRGAKPGMIVAEAVAAIEKNGGTCGDAMDIQNISFIRSQNRKSSGGMLHVDINSNPRETGIVYCNFKTGMPPEEPGSNFMPDRINIITSKITRRSLSNMSMPSWEEVQDAKVLSVSYKFYSQLTSVEMTKFILEDFSKKPSDVHGLRKDDPTEIIQWDGTVWRDMPQLFLENNLKLSVGVNINSPPERGYNMYTLQLNDNVLTTNFIRDKASAAEAERTSGPRPKF